MRVLNIHVFVKEGSIQIQFDAIKKANDVLDFLPINVDTMLSIMQEHPSPFTKVERNVVEDALRYTAPSLLQAACTPVILKLVSFKAKSKADHVQPLINWIQSSVIYEFPAIPHLALNWLLCVSIYLNKAYGFFNRIQCSDQNIIDHCTSSIDPADGDAGLPALFIEDFFSDKPDWRKNVQKIGLLLPLMEKILFFKEMNKYKNTLEVMEKFYVFHKRQREKSPIRFLSCLEPETRLTILSLDNLTNNIFNSEVKIPDKITSLFNFARKLIATNQTAELNFLLANIAHLAKKKLFAFCINKTAHDRKKYNWTYTEWDFIRYAEFRFRQDGRLCIINVKTNKGYNQHYAKDQRNHAVFQAEMEWLASILQIEFERGYELRYKSNQVEFEKNKLYIEKVGSLLEYTVIDPFNKRITATINEDELKHPIPEQFQLSTLNPMLSDILRITTQRKHTQPAFDFHEEIIFTHESTEALKLRGLHFNEYYLKKLLLRQNHWGFFKTCSIKSLEQDINILQFPDEVLEMILRDVNPQGIRLDPEEERQVMRI